MYCAGRLLARQGENVTLDRGKEILATTQGPITEVPKGPSPDRGVE